ncbi:MAG: sorbosone dehydrogenase family protein [Burkholderiales bacterium]|nr:sorbosone dehydrogenase family protein [Burkholderiales bacterium]MDE2564663.1 sorbosone dehydrogenase family protein [Burkholderiales bacterium]
MHHPTRRSRTGRSAPLALLPLLLGLAACGDIATQRVEAGSGPHPVLPAPVTALLPTVHVAPARGWPEGMKPRAAPGLQVAAYATGLAHPRWLCVLPDGDVLVAETSAPPQPDDTPGIKGWFMRLFMRLAGSAVPSPDRIVLLRDSQGRGVADQRWVLLEGLHSPFGMALVGGALYVADTDALLRVPYTAGQTRITAAPTRLATLPAGPINHHWTKNLIASPDGKRLYVTVGSNSNVGERGEAVEAGRAAIWQVDPATGAHRLYATGLRNANGMAFEPGTQALWTVVNERDELGSDLVPDYLAEVHDGDFFGWPWSWWGGHVDARVQPPRPDKVAQARTPDYALGPHTASLGLAEAAGNRLGPRYASGMFVGQHGSWNRRPYSGYRVVFVPFEAGRPAGLPQPVLDGFLSPDGQAWGRPVGVALARDGALLVADDVGNTVWRVSALPAAGVGR